VQVLTTGPRARPRRTQRAAILVTFWIVLASVSTAPGADAFWTSHVEPLLKEHCAECHNPTKTKSGLDVSSLQSMLRGGERGSALIPGRPDDSNLYKFLSSEADLHMTKSA
jgi:mono/diheme cytochrome c family protein